MTHMTISSCGDETPSFAGSHSLESLVNPPRGLYSRA